MTDKRVKIAPAKSNPRRITAERREALKRSLIEFGDLSGIVINTRTGQLVGGNQRTRALQKAGDWKVVDFRETKDKAGTVGVGFVETEAGRMGYREVDWDQQKEKAANIAANKHGGEFDYAEVGEIMRELENSGYDVSLTGFNDDEIENLPGATKEASDPPDATLPAPPKKSRVKPGEVWILGRHRLKCGDATSEKDVFEAFGGKCANLVFTDPPYGVSYEARSGEHAVLQNDDLRDDKLIQKLLLPSLKLAAKFSADQAGFYVWHASSTRDDFVYALKAAGLEERQYLIWAKPAPVLGHSDYRWSHEPCFYASKAGVKPAFYGDRAQSTVWEIGISAEKEAVVLGSGLMIMDGTGGQLYLQRKAPDKKSLRKVRVEGDRPVIVHDDKGAGTVWTFGRDHGHLHPTQKPVALAERAIENSSMPGDYVYDPFLGSGTTLMAAEARGRACIGLELDPLHCETIILRWESATKDRAVRAE